MQTPDQQAETAMSTLLDQAIGNRERAQDERLRARIWQILREEQIEMARTSEEVAS